ncbi:MAG: ABC transporter permease [Chloroflexota bacterium]|nr:ABC transporter permease [Chloroflexota bacterium]
MAPIARKRREEIAIAAPAANDTTHDQRTLGLDMLALVALFLVIVTYHLQNPILLYDVQFGSAFRNATLQPVLAVGLLGATLLLAGDFRTLRTHIVRLEAVILLFLYSLYMIMAVIFDFNMAGSLMGIDQALFLERLPDEVIRAPLESHLNITAFFEYLAILAVLMLWQPWQRFAVYGRAVRLNASPLIVAIVVLVLLEGVINIFQIEEFLLPRPSVIAATFGEIYPRLVSVGWNTFQNAFWGFVIGCGAGILTGMLSARFTGFSRALLPLAIGINAVPIIALAPIMNNWFGAINPASKIAIVAVLTYFPAMISTVRGLNSVDHLSLELMKSYAASQWEIFWKVRLPSALPFIFSSLKVATTLSMIGAIVSEYFGGTGNGLGFSIRNDAAFFKNAEAWSGIVIASLFGIGFYVVVSAAERALMYWHVSFREK